MIRPQPKPPKVVQDEARLQFVRAMPCLVAEFGASNVDNHDCGWGWYSGIGWVGWSEAHHIRKGAQTGLSRKPPANQTIPLCRAAHDKYHRIGHDSFCAKYGLDLEAHLRRINAEFAKLHTKPKRERKKRMTGTLHILHCTGCGQSHEIPWRKRITDRRIVKDTGFRCINTNQVIEVQ